MVSAEDVTDVPHLRVGDVHDVHFVSPPKNNFCWSIGATFHLGPTKMIAMALHQFHRLTEMRRQMEIHRWMEMRQPKALRKTRRRTEKPRGPLLDLLAVGHGMLWILRRLIPFCILLVVFIPTTWELRWLITVCICQVVVAHRLAD